MQTSFFRITLLGLALFTLSGCTPPPPVNTSRDLLWNKYGNKPVDDLILGWGAPTAETKLTDGSRLLTYRHTTAYDDGATLECEVSFLAHVPNYIIDNIAMKGDPRECQLLAQGVTGTTIRSLYMDTPMGTPSPYPFYR